MATPSKKKVVRAASQSGSRAAEAASNEPTWRPTEEAKGQATRLRIFAWIGWLLAIALEAVLIFWLLRTWASRGDTANMVMLIGGIVVIGIFASVGSWLWKKANRLDPASKKDTVRFFVQNQLGAIMSIIAFLPLIIMIFLNKDMDGKQKGIAGGIGIVIAAIAIFVFGIDYNAPSQEQYAAEEHVIMQLSGEDKVYWVKNGSVFHVCSDVPDVNRESKDGQIYEGTVAEAHAEGKERISKRWPSDAVNHCGYTQEQVDAVIAGMPVDQAAEVGVEQDADAELESDADADADTSADEDSDSDS